MSIDVHLMLSTGDVSYHSLLDNKLNLIVESHLQLSTNGLI